MEVSATAMEVSLELGRGNGVATGGGGRGEACDADKKQGEEGGEGDCNEGESS